MSVLPRAGPEPDLEGFMKRRDLLTSVFVAGLTAPIMGDGNEKKESSHDDDHGGHGRNDDRSTNIAVSFGNWQPTPDYPADPAELNTANPQPIDRFAPNDPNPRRLNGHALIPSPVKARVGDTVSFIISGFHNVQIYGPGVQPTDIDRTKVQVTAPFPPIIDDPDQRLYRGLDPRTETSQDRVEVVGFNTPGRYLVICGVLPHFFDPATNSFVMFGYVDVHHD
jgi:plastocyanin